MEAFSMQMIESAVKARRHAHESDDEYCKRVTSMSLNNRKLNTLKGIEKLPNVRVLFVYNNLIDSVKPLSFNRILTHLYLENNRLTSIADLKGLNRLVKLTLDSNQITKLDGLDGCTALEELSLSDQTLPNDNALQFETASIRAIAGTLKVLKINNCQVQSIEPLKLLTRLDTFLCAQNRIEDLNEVVDFVQSCTQLIRVDFAHNPVTNVNRYRDSVIVKSNNIQIIDDKDVAPNHREFLRAQFARQVPKKKPSADSIQMDGPFGTINQDAFKTQKPRHVVQSHVKHMKQVERPTHAKPSPRTQEINLCLNVGSASLNSNNQNKS